MDCGDLVLAHDVLRPGDVIDLAVGFGDVFSVRCKARAGDRRPSPSRLDGCRERLLSTSDRHVLWMAAWTVASMIFSCAWCRRWQSWSSTVDSTIFRWTAVWTATSIKRCSFS